MQTTTVTSAAKHSQWCNSGTSVSGDSKQLSKCAETQLNREFILCRPRQLTTMAGTVAYPRVQSYCCHFSNQYNVYFEIRILVTLTHQRILLLLVLVLPLLLLVLLLLFLLLLYSSADGGYYKNPQLIKNANNKWSYNWTLYIRYKEHHEREMGRF